MSAPLGQPDGLGRSILRPPAGDTAGDTLRKAGTEFLQIAACEFLDPAGKSLRILQQLNDDSSKLALPDGFPKLSDFSAVLNDMTQASPKDEVATAAANRADAQISENA